MVAKKKKVKTVVKVLTGEALKATAAEFLHDMRDSIARLQRCTETLLDTAVLLKASVQSGVISSGPVSPEVVHTNGAFGGEESTPAV